MKEKADEQQHDGESSDMNDDLDEQAFYNEILCMNTCPSTLL